MNARQAAELGAQLTNELFESAKVMSERNGKTISECIDHKVGYYVRKANTTTEAVAWELRGEEAKKMIVEVVSEKHETKTFEVTYTKKVGGEKTILVIAKNKEQALLSAKKLCATGKNFRDAKVTGKVYVKPSNQGFQGTN